jgi:hypothetical protein
MDQRDAELGADQGQLLGAVVRTIIDAALLDWLQSL